MNWRDLKPGDNFKVTLPATVLGKTGEYIEVVLGERGGPLLKLPSWLANRAKLHLVERPLRVGRAEFKPKGESCQVLAIHGNVAWIISDHDKEYAIVPVHSLINIDEEPQP